MTLSTTTAPTPGPPAEPAPRLTASETDAVERRLAGLARFAGAHASSAPRGLLGDLRRADWLALSEEERLARIRANLVASALERRTAAEARRAGRAPATPAPASAPSRAPRETAPEPEPEADEPEATEPEPDDAPAGRVPLAPGDVVVACAGGCGAWLRTRPGRPVLMVCGGRGPGRRRPRAEYAGPAVPPRPRRRPSPRPDDEPSGDVDGPTFGKRRRSTRPRKPRHRITCKG